MGRQGWHEWAPSLEIGVGTRFQLVPDFTLGVEPRLRWSPLNQGVIRPYFQVGLSFIQVRNNVDLHPVVPDTDSITSGTFGIGIGGGIAFQVSRNFALAIELHTMTIVPDITFAIDTELKFRFKF